MSFSQTATPPPPPVAPGAVVLDKPHALATSRIIQSFILGVVLYGVIMLLLIVLHRNDVENWMFTFIYERLLMRGSIPHFMTVGFTMGLSLLLVRLPLLAKESNRMTIWHHYLARTGRLDDEAVMKVPGGYKGETLVDSVLHQMVARSTTADNRAEMDAMVEQITSVERRKVDASHVPVRYLIWLIPTLGFLGTVLGISLAVAGFSEVITSGSGQANIDQNLVEICRELGVAFDTTFIALIYSSIIALFMAYVDRRELGLLNLLDEFYALSVRPRLAIENRPVTVTSVADSGQAAAPAFATGMPVAGGYGGGGPLVVIQTGDTGESANVHDVAKQIMAQSLAALSVEGSQISDSLANAGVAAQLKHFIEANLVHMKEQISWMQNSAITRDDLRVLSETFASQASRLEELLKADAQRQAESQAIMEKLAALTDKLHTEGVSARITINSLVSTPGQA